MLKISFRTSKKREQIVNEAEKFFKEKGLITKEKGDCCLQMEGGGGYVRLDIAENDKNEVTLETREWEYQVKQFIEQHGK
jgi:hypothetical protein